MIATYKVVARAIATIVALQAAFIAVGVFGLFTAVENQGLVLSEDSLEDELTFTGSVGFMLHAMGAMLIVLLALALIGLSFAVGRDAPKWAGIVLGLAVLQYALGLFSEGLPWLGALHGLNAFALFAMALVAARKAQDEVAGSADQIELRNRSTTSQQQQTDR
jgi:hypothetical protein